MNPDPAKVEAILKRMWNDGCPIKEHSWRDFTVLMERKMAAVTPLSGCAVGAILLVLNEVACKLNGGLCHNIQPPSRRFPDKVLSLHLAQVKRDLHEEWGKTLGEVIFNWLEYEMEFRICTKMIPPSTF